LVYTGTENRSVGGSIPPLGTNKIKDLHENVKRFGQSGFQDLATRSGLFSLQVLQKVLRQLGLFFHFSGERQIASRVAPLSRICAAFPPPSMDATRGAACASACHVFAVRRNRHNQTGRSPQDSNTQPRQGNVEHA
jgi:hypothetical protein